MAKKRVYVESSVISWLTANPPNDILKIAKQRQTQMWWEVRHRWELFISPMVMGEIQRGDRDAARKRSEVVFGLPLLDDTKEVGVLAEALIQDGLFPEKANPDAMHVAYAAIYGIDYLVTWNQKHLFNLDLLEPLRMSIRQRGYAPPILARPDYFLEANHGA